VATSAGVPADVDGHLVWDFHQIAERPRVRLHSGHRGHSTGFGGGSVAEAGVDGPDPTRSTGPCDLFHGQKGRTLTFSEAVRWKKMGFFLCFFHFWSWSGISQLFLSLLKTSIIHSTFDSSSPYRGVR
jgi:hypothetical protein